MARKNIKEFDCMGCPQMSYCCQEGAWVDLDEALKISRLRLRGVFTHLRKDKTFPSGYKLSTSRLVTTIKDSPCTFLTDKGLCSIHKIDYGLKPTHCRDFPYENGRLSQASKYYCLLLKRKKKVSAAQKEKSKKAR